MGKIIYHNIVYQYLHTRTQHKNDMVVLKEIQFPNRTMKIMFLFSLGKILLSLFLCLGFGDNSDVTTSSINLHCTLKDYVEIDSIFLYRDALLKYFDITY